MKKVCAVVGARPQFIKLAMVSRILRKRFHEVIIHTGQHYDYNMSELFFEELDIPRPDYNLGISGGTHGKMTGEMLIAIEQVLMEEHPDLVLLFGDTNSTIAAALAAVKLQIPICHVEAGGRLGTLENPEEVNRIVTDHVSSLLLACTASGVGFLEKEGLSDRTFLVGDPMYDAFSYYTREVREDDRYDIVDFEDRAVTLPKEFYYMTCHRQENTDTEEKLKEILSAMNGLDAPTIYPVHPRNHRQAEGLCEACGYKNIRLVRPVGYKTSIYLVTHAKKIVTDSGGLQREAFFAQKQCVTILDHIVWPETMVNGCNRLSKPISSEIIRNLSAPFHFAANYHPFGDGHSSEKIVDQIQDYLYG